MEHGLLSVVFVSALMFAALMYHIPLYYRSGERIHLAISILALGFSLLPVISSSFTVFYFPGSIQALYQPVFEIGVFIILLTGIYFLTAHGKPHIIRQTYILSVFISAFAMLITFGVITAGLGSFLSNAESLSFIAVIEPLLVAFIVYTMYKRKNLPKIESFFLSTFVLFLVLSVLSVITGVLPFLQHNFLYLPVILYSLSLYYLLASVLPQNVTVEKIIVPTEDNGEKKEEHIQKKSEPAPKTETVEYEETINFSKLLKHKINIYNDLPDTFIKIDRAICEGMSIRALPSQADSFIHSLFSFIRNSAAKDKNPYIILAREKNNFMLNAGDFVLNAKDRSLSIDKIRLSEVKNSCGLLHGFMHITESRDNQHMIRIRFEECDVEDSSLPETKAAEQTGDFPGILIINTDSDESFESVAAVFDTQYKTIRVSSSSEVIEAVFEADKPVCVISAMNDDMLNEDAFYKLEKIKEFSDIPLVIIGNMKKPSYLALKHYKLVTPVYLQRPYEKTALLEAVTQVFTRLNLHKERNIHQIGSKIEKSHEESGDFNTRFMEKAEYYHLNEYEKKIILYLLKGYEYRDTAVSLRIDEEKLLRAIEKIYEKTNVASRIELINLFISKVNG